MEPTHGRRVRRRSLVRRLVPFVVFCVTLPFGWMSSCRGGTGATGFDVIAMGHRSSPALSTLMIALAVLPMALAVVAAFSSTRRARVSCDVVAFLSGVVATFSWFLAAVSSSIFGRFLPPGILGLLALGAVALEALWAGVQELRVARAESRYGPNARPP